MAQVPTIDELVFDLMELRRGHGVLAADAPTRAGSAVRRQCGIEPEDGNAVVRRKLLIRLGDLAADLPDHLRPVVQGALALVPANQHRFLHQRMAQAAREIDRDHPRTAQRRLDGGLRLLAERLLVTAIPELTPDREWHTISLDARLRMDVDPPVLTETRIIRAMVDNLDELSAELTIPRRTPDDPPVQVEATVLAGGEIVERNVQTLTFASFLVRLPKPLMFGDLHEYAIEFTGPRRAAFSPLYVMEPLRRCDHFGVRITFRPGSEPRALWRISGLSPRRVDEKVPTAESLPLDAAAEASATFRDLIPGLSYGLQWAP